MPFKCHAEIVFYLLLLLSHSSITTAMCHSYALDMHQDLEK